MLVLQNVKSHLRLATPINLIQTGEFLLIKLNCCVCMFDLFHKNRIKLSRKNDFYR